MEIQHHEVSIGLPWKLYLGPDKNYDRFRKGSSYMCNEKRAPICLGYIIGVEILPRKMGIIS